MKLCATIFVALAGLGCRLPDSPAPGGDPHSGDSESASESAGTETSVETSGTEEHESDGLKYDVESSFPLLDVPPEPPDPFEPAPLGCEGARDEGPLLAIDFAGAWLDPSGLIRLRLVDDDPQYYWDIELDLEPVDMLPALHTGVGFTGYLTEPALWEWWHGSINGTVEVELLVAEPEGCLVAAILASTNDWHSEAPPLGLLVVPLQPWPE